MVTVATLMLAAASAWGQATTPGTFTDVIALDFSKTADQGKITVNGNAKFMKNAGGAAVLRLTSDKSQASSAFLPTSMRLSDYQVQFDFQVTPVGTDTTPADGFAYVAQTAGAAKVGGNGGSLGYGGGIQESGYNYALEFNSYPSNGLSTTSPQTVALDIYSPIPIRQRLGDTALPFYNTGVWHAVVRVTDDNLTATFTGGNLAAGKSIVYTSPSFLSDFFQAPAALFMGFTAGTGGAREIVDVMNFRVQVPA